LISSLIDALSAGVTNTAVGGLISGWQLQLKTKLEVL
jgi:hypothetical protein